MLQQSTDENRTVRKWLKRNSFNTKRIKKKTIYEEINYRNKRK